jgi:hypothetical protein
MLFVALFVLLICLALIRDELDLQRFMSFVNHLINNIASAIGVDPEDLKQTRNVY